MNLIMLFQNILVPWDGSKYSDHAFKVALDMAKKYDSKISVIHCIEDGNYSGPWYADSMYSNAIIKKQKTIAKVEINRLVIQAKNAKIPIFSDILIANSTVQQLVTYAKLKKIDLVVMGSHGRTGWSKMLLGSVTNGISQQIHCPVLIVK